MKSPKDSESTTGQVVDLSLFRKSKATKTEFAPGRDPLYVSHSSGKVTGKAGEKRPADSADFGDRLQRIRASLDKINRLMSDLKKMSADGPTPITSASAKESQKK